MQLPADTVFGRILPALGIALPLGNLFYAYLAWQLGKAEGRSDVTAMPYGPSVPHMFIVVFLVMLPVYLETKDPMLAWQAGLAWCFIIGVIVLLGAFVGPQHPRDDAARRDARHAGRHLGRVHLDAPGVPDVGDAVDRPRVLRDRADRLDRQRAPARRPARRAGRGDRRLGDRLDRVARRLERLHAARRGRRNRSSTSACTCRCSRPTSGPASAKVAPLLATAIPLGIYNFTEAMNNVESASAAGDNYNLRKILLADGLGAVVGSMLGSPFPPAVYIGHPGWKAVGGRIGYSLATGVAIALVCFLGLTALLLALIPLVAILPILLYIGLVIGAQAFQASPAKHAPAVVLALIPNIAEWAKTQIDGALGAAGTSAATVGLDKLAGFGVLYKGLESVGGGSVLAGMVLGAMAVHVIDNKMRQAAGWAFAGAVLSYIGLIHGSHLGWQVSPLVALGYVMFGATCLVLERDAAGDAGCSLTLKGAPHRFARCGRSTAGRCGAC